MGKLYTFPPFDELVLPSGIRFICIHDDEQDGFVLMHQFPFGRFSDPEKKDGCAELTFALMQKGIEGCESEKFSEIFEHAGAVLFSDVTEEHSMLGVRMLSSAQETLLPLFFGMVTKPSMLQSELSRLQREMVTAIRAEQVEPSVIAQNHFVVETAGKQHPLGKLHTVKSVGSIRLDEVKTFFKKNVIPAGSIIVAAGKFDPARLKKNIETIIGQWETGLPGVEKFASALEMKPSGYRFIEKTDSTQATLIIGHEAPGDEYPDRNALIVANYILGGGNFSSRLMTRIRSESGKTYGIHSQIGMQKRSGLFSIATSTQNNQVRTVIQGILDTLRDFVEKGITQEELDNARQYFIGNMAFQLEGIGNVAEKILWLRTNGYPETYVENYDQMLNELSLEKINVIIKEIFKPDMLKIVVVGRKDELLSQLSSFGAFKVFHFRDSV
ncbi:MAG TPA: pitrilysin family protein [Chitinispirillaceae bacterium]|nr:pitrilysin family protein [Chitinispirillaceae bacterium]